MLHLGERQVIQRTHHPQMAVVPWRWVKKKIHVFLKDKKRKGFAFFLCSLSVGDLKIQSLVLSLPLIYLLRRTTHIQHLQWWASERKSAVATAGNVMKPTGKGGKNDVILSCSEAFKVTGFIFLFSLSGVPCIQWWKWKWFHLMFSTELFWIYSDVLLFFLLTESSAI